LGAGLVYPAWGRGRDAEGEWPTLREAADARGFWIGPAVSYNPLINNPTYGEVLSREFNILTPENAMKWSPIHPQQHQYNFTQADTIADFAWTQGMPVHGHTLVWHSSLPAWLVNGEFDRDQMLEILADHIYTLGGRYSGYVAMWDVINEGVNVDGTLRDTIWRERIGDDYLDWAFWFARDADPYALLLYNDWGAEGINAKSTGIYNLVTDMMARGVPIDGIGFQMHITTTGINYQSFAQNLQRFADLGLLLFVTEMDVRIQLPVTDAKLQAQANVYRNVLDVCLQQPSCWALQTWGFTDAHSWIPGFYPGFGAALPFDENYDPKPAYWALLDGLLS
jgi:endo-1,4-beta-xylanase